MRCNSPIVINTLVSAGLLDFTREEVKLGDQRMLDGYAADYDDGAEIGDLVQPRPAPGFATRPGPAWRVDEMPAERRHNQPTRVLDPAAAAGLDDSQGLTAVPRGGGALLLARRRD